DTAATDYIGRPGKLKTACAIILLRRPAILLTLHEASRPTTQREGGTMLTMLGSKRRACDGLTRRETLQAGALALLGGMSLPNLLAAEDADRRRRRPGRAKNVIMLYLLGGAATQDMIDLKPNAPPEVRGEFRPIATNITGIQICEHLPRMSRWLHKIALVRSLNHKPGCHNTLPSYTRLEQ